jgi:hypothetical protein
MAGPDFAGEGVVSWGCGGLLTCKSAHSAWEWGGHATFAMYFMAKVDMPRP